jgi:hypothetical protein
MGGWGPLPVSKHRLASVVLPVSIGAGPVGDGSELMFDRRAVMECIGWGCTGASLLIKGGVASSLSPDSALAARSHDRKSSL